MVALERRDKMTYLEIKSLSDSALLKAYIAADKAAPKFMYDRTIAQSYVSQRADWMHLPAVSYVYALSRELDYRHDDGGRAAHKTEVAFGC